MNSFGLFGFLWHCSTRQGTLSGLANSTYSISTLVPLVMLSVFPLTKALWLSSAFAGGSVLLCYVLVPTSQEYHAEAFEALGVKLEAPPLAICAALRTAWQIFKIHRRANTLFTVSLFFMLSFYQYY